ncbi:MAG: NAD-dependent epimerase/dehydratase family protein, partial [Bacteroidota bacterium]
MIAVTGATGFLGAHLVCRLLQQGKAVRALKRIKSSREEFDYIYSLYFTEGTAPEQLTWVDADILDLPALAEALTGVDEVYHCAAVVSFNPSDKDYMMKANIEGTANVVNTCLDKQINRLAYISSIAALGREKSGTEITEKTKWTDSK